MRKGRKQNDEKYLKGFIDLHNEILNDPRCKTQKVLRKWKMSNGVTSILQRMNVIDKDENHNTFSDHFWTYLRKRKLKKN